MQKASTELLDSLGWVVMLIENGRHDVAAAMLRQLAEEVQKMETEE